MSNELALAFVSALITKRYEDAYRLLAPELRAESTVADLQDGMLDLFSIYDWDTAPYEMNFSEENSMEDWPGKEESDMGWVYVGIMGQGAVEAVTVIVAMTAEGARIRVLEWGRP